MRTRAAIGVMVAITLLAVACGSRVSDKGQQSAGGLDGGGGAAAPAPTTPSSDGMFGTIASPCGPGNATGATDVGVTNEEIRIGTISDPGGAKPGLNQGIFDSMQAFQKWCNDQGGINGRKLKVDLLDAKLSEYQAQVVSACENDLAMVGGLGVLDQTGAQDQVDCHLPNIPGAVVSPEAAGADFTFQPLPNPTNAYNVGPAQWVADRFPDAISKAAALRTNLSITQLQSERLKEAYTQVGFDFIYTDDANVGETNWAPIVVNMKNKDIQYMTLTSSFEEVIPLQKEMALQGVKPVTELETNFYTAKYPAQAGAAADGTFVRLTVWPFEEPDKNPAMKQFLDALGAAVPGAQPDELGVQAWSAALMWATSVKALGSNVTRTALLDQLETVTKWDGGGLHGTTDPATDAGSGCFIIMKVADGGFVREYPLEDSDAEVYDAGKGFACPSDDIVTLHGDYGTGAKAKK